MQFLQRGRQENSGASVWDAGYHHVKNHWRRNRVLTAKPNITVEVAMRSLLLRAFFIFSVIVAGLLSASCNRIDNEIRNQSGPVPVILQDRSGQRGDMYAVTVRNNGAVGMVRVAVVWHYPGKGPQRDGNGNVRVTVAPIDQKLETFNAGEERTIMFPVPSGFNGRVEMQVERHGS